MAELSAGEIGSTATSGRETRPVTLCGRWSCSVLHWAERSVEGTAIWQLLHGQKKLQGYAITLSFVFLSQGHLPVQYLLAFPCGRQVLKTGEGRIAPPVGSGAPLASFCILRLEEKEFRRSRWLCRALTGSLTSLLSRRSWKSWLLIKRGKWWYPPRPCHVVQSSLVTPTQLSESL